MKRFQLAVFGKQGCDKCELLKKRLTKILGEEDYADFEYAYNDLGTPEGLVRFCRAEILNPQRVPSFMVYRIGEGEAESALRPVRRRKKVSAGEEIDTFLALETDYRTTGVITPEMIKKVLDTALEKITADV